MSLIAGGYSASGLGDQHDAGADHPEAPRHRSQ